MKPVKIYLFIVLFVTCGYSSIKDVKILKKDFLNTIVGTTKNKKLVKHIPRPKPKPKPKLKIKKQKVFIQKIIIKPDLPVAQKKKLFKEILVPIITKVYKELDRQYYKIKKDLEEGKNTQEIDRLRKYYNLKKDDDLLHSLKPHPISIVLAQAAIESAWLTSRFTTQANNIFGVWSFNKNEPRIAAAGLRENKTIYLKKYNNLEEAIKDYYKNLGKNWAYKKFREQRVSNNNPYELVLHLKSYSEKKEEYIKMLQKVIKYNKFDMYDIDTNLSTK
jgi:Bax protein